MEEREEKQRVHRDNWPTQVLRGPAFLFKLRPASSTQYGRLCRALSRNVLAGACMQCARMGRLRQSAEVWVYVATSAHQSQHAVVEVEAGTVGCFYLRRRRARGFPSPPDPSPVVTFGCSS